MIKANSATAVIMPLWILLLQAHSIQAQGTGSLKIQNIRLVIDGKEITTHDLTFPFEWNKDSKEYELYRDNQLSIVAKYKLSTHKSDRSSIKSSQLNVTIRYFIVMNGQKDKHRSEKIFYLDQERKFDVAELFVFKEGFNNSSIKLNYSAILVQ